MKDIIPEIEDVKKMAAMISSQTTGTPEEFAKAFNCHPRTMQGTINYLNKILKPQKTFIRYSKDLGSYYYTTPGHFVIEFKFVKDI